MATLHDSDQGSNDASGTTLAAPAIDITTGDLIVVLVKYEGAVDASASVTFNQTVTDTGSSANKANANGDLNARLFYARATTTGTIVATMNTPGSRPFRITHVYSLTPAGGTVLNFDVEAVAGEGNTAAPTTSAASVSAAGAAVAGFGYYNSKDTSAGTGWTVLPGLTTSAAGSEYRFPTGAGSITGDCTIIGASPWAAVMLAFKQESAGGGGQVNARNGIALSGISAINGIAKSSISHINGLTI